MRKVFGYVLPAWRAAWCVVLLAGVRCGYGEDVKAGERLGKSENMCGPIALCQVAYLMKHEKHTVTEMAVMADTDPLRGTTLWGLQSAAKKMGLESQILKGDFTFLQKDNRLKLVTLALGKKEADPKHIVLLDSVEREKVGVIDGATRFELPAKEFRSLWTGYAVAFGPVPAGQDGWGWDRVAYVCGGGVLLSFATVLLVAPLFRRRGREGAVVVGLTV